MSFLWGKTAAATTKGLEIEALADKLIEERGTRMTKLGATLCQLFVADVEIIVRRRIALDPWGRVIVIKANDVVTDSYSTSYHCFNTIRGTTKKELTSDEEWVLLRALLAASKEQDYTVVIDDGEGTATLDFSDAKKLAQHRQAAKDAPNAKPVDATLVDQGVAQRIAPGLVDQGVAQRIAPGLVDQGGAQRIADQGVAQRIAILVAQGPPPSLLQHLEERAEEQQAINQDVD